MPNHGPTLLFFFLLQQWCRVNVRLQCLNFGSLALSHVRERVRSFVRSSVGIFLGKFICPLCDRFVSLCIGHKNDVQFVKNDIKCYVLYLAFTDWSTFLPVLGNGQFDIIRCAVLHMYIRLSFESFSQVFFSTRYTLEF